MNEQYWALSPKVERFARPDHAHRKFRQFVVLAARGFAQQHIGRTSTALSAAWLCGVMSFFLQHIDDHAIQTHAAPRRFQRNLAVQVTTDPHVE